MNQGFWMTKGTESMNDGDVNYDNSSRADLKRSHQWFMDGPEAELFSNKKQAMQVPNNNLFTGLLNSAPWGNPSSFQSISGHFSEQLFDSETARTDNFEDRNMSMVNSEKANPSRKVEEDSFLNDSSFGLSIAHTLEDPGSGLNFGGIRKVKVSQVKESENLLHLPTKNDALLSNCLPYNKGDSNIMSVGESYDRESNIFISMGQPDNKEDDSMSMNQAFKESSNVSSPATMGHEFSKGENSIISMVQNYKPDGNGVSMGHLFNKGSHSTIISFGGYDEDDASQSGRLVSNYDLLMAQPSLQSSEVIENGVVQSNAGGVGPVGHTVGSGAENALKKKEDPKSSKKAASNNFPSNVRSLLSTGMLDGVPVKYIAWSREKELRGVIKDLGYLCGCQTCNFSKVINAYEFERHANCKTKHPNNHIYFENGKTIYGIVQELRSTPQNMLFEVIQTIAGSPINQKSFQLWKESFLAATRELQRIYGKDEGKLPL